MKKSLLVLMAALLAFSMMFVGCGDDAKKKEEELVSKGEEVVADAENAAKEAAETLKTDAEAILNKLELGAETTVEVLHEGADTVKYKFTVLGEDAAEKATEIETKVEELASEFGDHLETLKDKGVDEAKLIAHFVTEKGDEIYSKIFNK